MVERLCIGTLKQYNRKISAVVHKDFMILSPKNLSLNPKHAEADISCYEDSLDPNQLASEKLADQDTHCFPIACKYICYIINRN